MTESIEKMLEGKQKYALTGALGMLTLFLTVQVISGLAELRFVGSGIPATNTISVEGTGEAVAVPDIATVSFMVRFEEDTVAAAQEKATALMNTALGYLDEQNIEKKDIKTNSYNVYPQYDYIQTTCLPGVPCRGGESVLRGYEVSQSVSVKVRELEAVGAILGGLGELGVQNISGPNFEIDDIDAVRAEAREMAIKEAKDKAKELARDLNVRLVRVVNFWEDWGYYYPRYEEAAYNTYASDGKGGSLTPEIPVGENEITTRVNITYEIR